MSGTEDYLRRERAKNNAVKDGLQKACRDLAEIKRLIADVLVVADPIAQNLVYHDCGHVNRGTLFYEKVNALKTAIGQPGLIPDPEVAKTPKEWT